MARKRTHYMAVQVLQRAAGLLTEWYDGDERATKLEAQNDAIRNAREFVGTAFTVIQIDITEVSKAVTMRRNAR